MMDYAERTNKAMDNIKAGDHFHEFFAHHVFVIAKRGNRIKVLTAQAPCTLPEDGKVANITIDEFRKIYAYGSIPGYWVTYDKNIPSVKDWLPEFKNLPADKSFLPKETKEKIEVCECCKRPF